jgi:uncharacterized protein (DUF58 family)
VVGRLRDAWRRLRAWRRISFTSGGAVFTAGSLAVGFAAINTGNNLLYLLLGAMLGAMAVSGWLSEQSVRGVRVRRILPGRATAGRPVRVGYRVRNDKRRLSSMALEVSEPALGGAIFTPRIAPGEEVVARVSVTLPRRGVVPLDTVTVGTTWPFGFFRKERDLARPDELVVWPRTDGPVPESRPGAGRRATPEARRARGTGGGRGEYRSLREYRPGDDPRDIHWRSSARLSRPVVREYERRAARALWVQLDVSAPPGEGAEASVEVAAALVARAVERGRPVGFVAGPRVVDPASGPAHLETILDVLARVEFGAGGPDREPPPGRAGCVLVSAGRAPAAGWAHVHRVSGEGATT